MQSSLFYWECGEVGGSEMKLGMNHTRLEAEEVNKRSLRFKTSYGYARFAIVPLLCGFGYICEYYTSRHREVNFTRQP
jgi:hypothetical protein